MEEGKPSSCVPGVEHDRLAVWKIWLQSLRIPRMCICRCADDDEIYALDHVLNICANRVDGNKAFTKNAGVFEPSTFLERRKPPFGTTKKPYINPSAA